MPKIYKSSSVYDFKNRYKNDTKKVEEEKQKNIKTTIDTDHVVVSDHDNMNSTKWQFRGVNEYNEDETIEDWSEDSEPISDDSDHPNDDHHSENQIKTLETDETSNRVAVKTNGTNYVRRINETLYLQYLIDKILIKINNAPYIYEM